METIVKIKAGSINNLSDARYFSTFAEWVGYNFNPTSPNAVDLETAKTLQGWLSGPRTVAEFDDAPLSTIQSIAEQFTFDTLQTDLALDPNALPKQVSSIIQRFVVHPLHTNPTRIERYLKKKKGVISYFLFNFQTYGFTWQALQNHPNLHPDFIQYLCSTYPILLQMPFEASNVRQIVEQLQPAGLNIVGGNEEKVGLRSFEDIDPIIEQLEVEEEW